MEEYSGDGSNETNGQWWTSNGKSQTAVRAESVPWYVQ